MIAFKRQAAFGFVAIVVGLVAALLLLPRQSDITTRSIEVARIAKEGQLGSSSDKEPLTVRVRIVGDDGANLALVLVHLNGNVPAVSGETLTVPVGEVVTTVVEMDTVAEVGDAVLFLVSRGDASDAVRSILKNSKRPSDPAKLGPFLAEELTKLGYRDIGFRLKAIERI